MNYDPQNNFTVTSHFQQGGITAGHVNIGKQDRHFNEQSKLALMPYLPSKDKMINVTAVMGDQEAFQFACEIKNDLFNDGYKINGVNQAIFSQPITGQVIEPLKDGGIRIIIGGA